SSFTRVSPKYVSTGSISEQELPPPRKDSPMGPCIILERGELHAKEFAMADRGDTSLVVSALWMLVISMLLFFLPALNGLIGGAVGGFKAGSVKRGLIAALLPAIAAGLGIWALLAVFDAPIIGFLSGLAFGVWALISSIGLLIGAMVGGAMAPPRPAEIR